MSIIGVSGKLQSGKNTIAYVVQYLIDNQIKNWETKNIEEDFYNYIKTKNYLKSNYQQKSFAGKLKDIVCLLINCTREQLEDETFKNKELSKEWWSIKKWYPNNINRDKIYTLIPYVGFDSRIFDGDDGCTWKEIRMTPRLLLQLIGTEGGRDIIHPNIWCTSLMSEYKTRTSVRGIIMDMSDNTITDTGFKADLDDYPNWIITDVRFPNELEAIKQKKGIIIRVNRGKPQLYEQMIGTIENPIPTGVFKEHESETALDNAEFDYVIENNGSIEELMEKVRVILIKENLINE
jgi:hypothetical protein